MNPKLNWTQILVVYCYISNTRLISKGIWMVEDENIIFTKNGNSNPFNPMDLCHTVMYFNTFSSMSECIGFSPLYSYQYFLTEVSCPTSSSYMPTMTTCSSSSPNGEYIGKSSWYKCLVGRCQTSYIIMHNLSLLSQHVMVNTKRVVPIFT